MNNGTATRGDFNSQRDILRGRPSAGPGEPHGSPSTGSDRRF